ncbi:hypothetical protein ACOBR2_12285 [Telmatobacter bradus]|uniref:hypothetical protein n=1 Tax=Telmatobacter bradus TaxID=474953 RepID=UPI003B4381E2
MSGLDAMIPAPDHSHGAHGHGTGHKWLDILVAVSAIFISVVSLVVSIEHGRTMEKMVDQNQKMVEASTLPILSLGGNMLDTDGKRVEQIVLANEGTGPARIDRFEVRYKGVSYTDPHQLYMDCCAAALTQKKGGTSWHGVYYANVSGTVIVPHDKRQPIDIESASTNVPMMDAIERARDDMKMKACYCSVLNECWETNFDRQRPTPVAECKVKPDEKLW